MGVDKRKPGRPTDLEAAKRILARAGHISEAPEPPVIPAETTDEAEGEKKLTPRQAMFIAHMLRGMSAPDAAERAGFTRGYASQALLKPHVRRALDAGITAIYTDAVRDTISLSALAQRRRRDLLLDPTTPHQVVASVTRDVLSELRAAFETAIPKATETATPTTDAEAAKLLAGATSLPTLPDGVEG
jgi:hypothetical protein